MIGMANISFTENQTTLQGPNQTVPFSGSVSSISGSLHYRFLTVDRKAFYSQFTFPLMGGSTGTYLAGGAGMEYYWGSMSSKASLSDSTTSLVLSPTMRYFVLSQLNIGYLSYTTLTAKKNDTLMEIELGGGLSKAFTKWTLRAQASMARGIGVTTTTMGMKLFFGGIFFLD